jgi:SAM-dependent methyltransferase
MKKDFRNTSWQKVAPWYNKITAQGQGHYYHQHVVIPGVFRLLDLSQTPNSPNSKIQDSRFSILDMACGNGVLAKSLPKDVEYLGIDLSESLVNTAKKEDKNYKHKYLIADIANPLNPPNSLIGSDFSHAAIILALQNILNPLNALKNASDHLLTGGTLVIVLNHPAFRIPRQSSWGIDEERKIQYRRIDKYMSPMEIPINMNPSDRNSEKTISYHFPISYYSKILSEAGFVIELMEEWTSDKESVGRAGKMENRSRAEIPLFLAIKAKKTG